MCGLCGIVGLSGDAPPAAPALIDRMTDSLAHRGPSDRGTWCRDRTMLGSRRLAVIDLSRAGRQPMSTEDDRYHIVYNGEVYNFRELRDRFRLDEKGHRFRSRTDTEVLLHLFEELGVEMFQHLNGMFAVAIWDSVARRLVLGRDRYGIKPLFYQRDRDAFRFASEIKAILRDERVRRAPDLQALHDYLSFDYIPGTRTAFEGISEVPPGHFLTLDAEGAIRVTRYWDLDFTPDRELERAEVPARARGLMEEALRRRLIADVPIGVLLSGGLDSSAVLALMAAQTSGPIHTYSVGFEDASFNELPYARIMAARHQTAHREVVVTADTVRRLLEPVIRMIDEPYADGSAIPTYCVCELAADEVVVVLSGEGGDEAFAGYETHAALKMARWFRHVPTPVRRHLLAPVIRSLPVSHKKLSLEFKLKRFIGGCDLPIPEAHLWWRLVMSEAEKTRIYSPRLREAFEGADSARHFREAYGRVRAVDDLGRVLYVDSTVFLPDDLMIKNDRMSMAHSLEARVPFTDPELTAFMASVPSSWKLPGMDKKRILKDAMRDALPRRILGKKKVGLEMPYSRWFQGELEGELRRYLAPERLEATGLFDPAGIRTIVDQHMDGRADRGRALWGLLNYMIWYDLFIDGATL